MRVHVRTYIDNLIALVNTKISSFNFSAAMMNTNRKYQQHGMHRGAAAGGGKQANFGNQPELNLHPPTPTSGGSGWVSSNMAVTGGGVGESLRGSSTSRLPQIIPDSAGTSAPGSQTERQCPTDGLFRRPMNPPRLGANGQMSSNLSIASYKSVKGISTDLLFFQIHVCTYCYNIKCARFAIFHQYEQC